VTGQDEGFMANLIPVTIGNVIGGAVMVGIVYWFVYLRGSRSRGVHPEPPVDGIIGQPSRPTSR
jgi:hypothetical protein